MLSQISIIIIGIVLQATFIAVEHMKKYGFAVLFKGLASLAFVVLGIVCLKSNSTYSCLVITGLILGLFGDVLLNLRFVLKSKGDKVFLAGIAAFFSGHVMYLIAIVPYSKNIFIDIIIGVILTATLLAYIFKTMKVKIAFKIFGVFYLGIIIVMTCIAIDSAIFNTSIQLILFAIGAVAFTISDIVLIFNTFSGKEKFSMRITNLSFYYAAQILIALTLMFV